MSDVDRCYSFLELEPEITREGKTGTEIWFSYGIQTTSHNPRLQQKASEKLKAQSL